MDVGSELLSRSFKGGGGARVGFPEGVGVDGVAKSIGEEGKRRKALCGAAGIAGLLGKVEGGKGYPKVLFG